MTQDDLIHGPVQDPLTTRRVNERVRGYLEWCLDKLRSEGLEAIATGRDNPQLAQQRLHTMIRPEYRQPVLSMARDASVYVKWRQQAEVYDVHPAMTNSLLRLGSKARIPGSVFRRLRHANPYFITTAGVPVVHGDGQPGRIFGFYVCGALSSDYPPAPGSDARPLDATGTGGSRNRPAILLDTFDKDANALHVVVTSEVLDEARQNVLDLDFCHMTLPMTTDFTLKELVSEVAKSGGFNWEPSMRNPGHEGSKEPYLVSMARYAIAHLLYACSRTVEIAAPPAPRNQAKKKRGEPKPSKKPSQIRPMGYEIGARIQDYTRSPQKQKTGDGGGAAGYKMPPHVRAPHPHLYWVGPGKQDAEIKFLDPIPVNMTDGDADTVTVHPMK